MRLIRESVELSLLGEHLESGFEVKIGRFLESCGRICCRSEDKIGTESYKLS